MSDVPPPHPGEEDRAPRPQIDVGSDAGLAARDRGDDDRDPSSGSDARPGLGPREGQAPAPKRPRYLVVALSFALALGAGCWTEGCDKLAFYRGEHDHKAALHAQFEDEADRARMDALYTRFTEVADAAHKRAVPMAAAIFVLGAALLTLAGRGLAGRTNTRHALVQVVVAQALVVGANYFVTRDVRTAELDWQMDGALIQQRHAVPPEQFAELERIIGNARRYGPPSWLVFRTVVSGLIVFALTRPRSRAFFDARALGAASGQ